MKRISMFLGMIAVVASTLFVSCAQKHVPDQAMAFPRERAATYALNKNGVYTWTASSSDDWDATSKWTGFRVISSNIPTEIKEMGNAVLFYMATNRDWTASIAPESREYLKLRVYNNNGSFYDESSYSYVDEVSGVMGNQIELCIVVIKTPEFGEEPVETHLNLTMENQTMPLAKITIGPKAEDSGEEDM
jgi:hypothetical protein